MRRLLDESGLGQKQAVTRANKLLPDSVPELTVKRASERFAGDPGSTFHHVWALAEALLIACNKLKPRPADPGRGAVTAFELERLRSYEELRAQWCSWWHWLWEQARRDQPPGTDPRLSPYLVAAASFARIHPYPGLEDAPDPLPLPEGYVPQRALTLPVRDQTELASPGLAPAPATTGVEVSALDVFTSESPLSLLIGPPGCGKSTLLRIHVLDAADERTDGKRKRATAVPVLVPAVKLTGSEPLPEAMAEAVHELLGQYLPPDVSLTADFFEQCPDPQATWLVLVDGLDEIADHAARASLLDRLAQAARGTLYRIVVATRQIPPGDVATWKTEATRFELQPFFPDDLRSYAQDRFRSLGNPDHHTEQFITLIAEAGLDELARAPLMASMLCQLYAVAPGRRLPQGRSNVYGRFVEEMYRRNAHKRVADIQRQAIEALEASFQHIPDRQAVRAAAESTCNNLPKLINSLACQMFFEELTPTLDAVTSHPLARPPAPARRPEWNQFVACLLNSTGLLSVENGQLAFPHRTFLEFHAACYATRDKKESVRATRRLLNRGWMSLPGTWPFGPRDWRMTVRGHSLDRHLGADEASAREREDMSYAGFVLDLANDKGVAVKKRLMRVARTGGAKGGTFIALQAALGTRICPEAEAAARATLAYMALGAHTEPGAERLRAAETLVRLCDERGLEAFTAVADNPSLLVTLNPVYLPPRPDIPGTVPPPYSPTERAEARERTRRDTLVHLDAVMRDATLGDAARLQASRARAAIS
ncbi:NACHT domain-containing protein [Streptomyces xantholiticus]|uniref:NACHT domain-containing protein n=1 Tax=Streptomyces xantholiticus TaxID=68285 RepID=UPI00167542D1|nr:NACHT domain-containing protein [Streptomyces xantholiticus]